MKKKVRLGRIATSQNDLRKFGSAGEYEMMYAIRKGKIRRFAFTPHTLDEAEMLAAENKEDMPLLIKESIGSIDSWLLRRINGFLKSKK